MTDTNNEELFNNLKENVRKYMKEKGISQQQLGEKIGMSQSNVNKCLKIGDGSRSFTLEQVCALADYFGTTTDELLGRSEEKRKYSPFEICQLFAALISDYRIVHFDLKKTEEVKHPMDYDGQRTEKKDVTYDAFYFPNYITLPKYFGYERYCEYAADFEVDGNDIPDNISINEFLNKYTDAFEKYDKGEYSEGNYKILTDAYFKVLKEKN